MAKVTIRPANQDPKPPPTEAQLLRIDSMIDHPAFDDKLETLTKRMDSMLKTKGQAGILIGWMKGKIKEYDQECAHVSMFKTVDGMGAPIRQCAACPYSIPEI